MELYWVTNNLSRRFLSEVQRRPFLLYESSCSWSLSKIFFFKKLNLFNLIMVQFKVSLLKKNYAERYCNLSWSLESWWSRITRHRSSNFTYCFRLRVEPVATYFLTHDLIVFILGHWIHRDWVSNCFQLPSPPLKYPSCKRFTSNGDFKIYYIYICLPYVCF